MDPHIGALGPPENQISIWSLKPHVLSPWTLKDCDYNARYIQKTALVLQLLTLNQQEPIEYHPCSFLNGLGFTALSRNWKPLRVCVLQGIYA